MPVLLLLLIAMFVEITVLVLVVKAIGLLSAILLLILASMAGIWLLRREGARTLRSLQQAMRTGQAPHQAMIDGALIAAAAILILLPGFVSDVLALALLFPPGRALISRRVAAMAERRARTATPGGTFVVDSVVVDPVPNEVDRPQ